MADSVLSITDVQNSLGLQKAGASGLVVNATFVPAGGGLCQYPVDVAGVTEKSIVSAQFQVVTASDLTAGNILYSVQPVPTGAGKLLLTAKALVNPVTFSWVVHKF